MPNKELYNRAVEAMMDSFSISKEEATIKLEALLGELDTLPQTKRKVVKIEDYQKKKEAEKRRRSINRLLKHAVKLKW